MKNISHKVAAVVAGTAMLMGGGVACASTLTTSEKQSTAAKTSTTSTASTTPSTSSDVVNINQVGQAQILHVTNANEPYVKTNTYPSSIDAPDLSIAPWASVFIEFVMKPGTVLKTGEVIKIPFSQIDSTYATGHVYQVATGDLQVGIFDPNTGKSTTVDGFKLGMVGDASTDNSAGNPSAGYFTLTVKDPIANGKADYIYGAFSFNENFDHAGYNTSNTDASNTTFGTIVNGDKWSVNVHYQQLEANKVIRQNNIDVCEPTNATDFNGVDWSALQNAYIIGGSTLSAFINAGENANTQYYGYEQVTVPENATPEMSFGSEVGYVFTQNDRGLISNTHISPTLSYGSGYSITLPNWKGNDPTTAQLSSFAATAKPGQYAAAWINSTTIGVLYDLGSINNKQTITTIPQSTINGDIYDNASLNQIASTLKTSVPSTTATPESTEFAGVTVTWPNADDQTVESTNVTRNLFSYDASTKAVNQWGETDTTISTCPTSTYKGSGARTGANQQSSSSTTAKSTTTSDTKDTTESTPAAQKDTTTKNTTTSNPDKSADTTKPATTTNSDTTKTTDNTKADTTQTTPAKTKTTTDSTSADTTKSTPADQKDTTTKNTTTSNPNKSADTTKSDTTQTTTTSKDTTAQKSTTATPAKTTPVKEETEQLREPNHANPVTAKDNLRKTVPVASESHALAKTGASVVAILVAMLGFFGLGVVLKKRGTKHNK